MQEHKLQRPTEKKKKKKKEKIFFATNGLNWLKKNSIKAREIKFN